MRSKTLMTMTLGMAITMVLLWGALRTTPTLAQVTSSPDRAAALIGPAPQPASSTVNDDWYIACVDCPKEFSLGNQGLQLDNQNRPHLAYGGDHLYYAWDDGSQWQYTTVDNSSGTGRYASLALDNSDRPHIAYYDSVNGDLKYAHWTGSVWQVEIVDSTGDVGASAALAFDSAGRPQISYSDGTNFALKYARWTGSTWHIETIPVSADAADSALALDQADQPTIVYRNGSQGSLELARWTGGNWITQTIDYEDLTGYFTDLSLALDSKAAPHVTYTEWGGGAGSHYYYLKYASAISDSWNIQTLDQFSYGGSLRLDNKDRPYIGYTSLIDGIKYIYWNGTGWVSNIVEGGYGTVALALDTDNKAHIGYFAQFTRQLRYAQPVASGWDIETVDQSSTAGEVSSIKLDQAQRPQIAYLDQDSNLKYARWLTDTWNIQMIDHASQPECKPALALGPTDMPHIAYCSPASNINYAYWNGTTWVTQTVAAGDNLSLALDKADNPYISFRTYAGLQLAHWTGSNWQIETVDNASDVGWSSSLALDADNHPHISYFDWTNYVVKYAHWTGSAWEIQILESGFKPTALALDPAGRPHIAYYSYVSPTGGYNLKYAHWTGTTWEKTVLGNVPSYLLDVTLAVDQAGLPHLGYYNMGTLLYVQRNGAGWETQTVDSLRSVGLWSAMALDKAGYPHFSYYDEIDGDLKYAALAPPLLFNKTTSPRTGVNAGDQLAFTLTISSSGLDVQVVDPLPDTLAYISGTVSAPATYDAATRSIVWQGDTLTATAQSITFQALVSTTSSSPIVNTAWLTDTLYARSRSATAIINGWYAYLPVITRR